MSQKATAAARSRFGELVRNKAFTPINRFLPIAVAEERVQEGTCMAFAMYADRAAKGIDLDPAILVHFAKNRACDPTRYFVGADGARRSQDVLSPALYLTGKVQVESLDGVPTDEGPADGDKALGLAVSGGSDPTDSIIGALDLAGFISALSERDQQTLALRFAGFTLAEVGEKLGLSVTMVHSRCRSLGKALAARAGVEVEKRSYHRREAPALQDAA